MKKILLTLACVFGMSIKASALSTTAILLQHNGNITTYAAEDIATVMEEASDGDEVFLNEGTFPGFTITKKLKISGVGEKSIIDGDINIKIPDEPTLNANLLEYLKINGTVDVKSSLKRLVIKQCTITKNMWFEAKTYDSLIDRCEINGDLSLSACYSETITLDGNSETLYYPYVKGLTVKNSIIYKTFGPSDAHARQLLNASYINCYITCAYQSLGNVINSIIYSSYNRNLLNDGKVFDTVFVNTYYSSGNFDSDTCTRTDCYWGDELEYDSEDIATNGYLGNDGTIIGPLGGNTPYTLTPTVPHVTEANLKVDPKKQELNATLTVSPN